MDAELAGGLPQPDLADELVGPLGRQGAAEDAIVGVDAAGVEDSGYDDEWP